MRITKWMLNGLALVIAAIMLLKLVVWLATDYPISRGSMLILAGFVVFLSIKKWYTFILLVCLVVSCWIYKFFHAPSSGYLVVDFMSSIRNADGSIIRFLMYFQEVFYMVMVAMILLPWTWKVYFSRNEANPKEHEGILHRILSSLLRNVNRVQVGEIQKTKQE